MYLFFDTETTGLNKSSDRIIQIAWLVTARNGKEIKRQNRLIKPSGFTIPKNAEKIHGISTITANRFGASLRDVLIEFTDAATACQIIVGHNLSFDLAMLKPEYLREDIPFPLDGKRMVCTMRSATAWCRLPKLDGRPGFKWPKLDELYFRLFGEYFDDAHDALNDVVATKRVYFELIKRNIISENDVSSYTDDIALGELRPKPKIIPNDKKQSTPKSEKNNDVAHEGLENSKNVSDVFSWDWSAPGQDKYRITKCPLCNSNCNHRVNSRKQLATCLTCYHEYRI